MRARALATIGLVFAFAAPAHAQEAQSSESQAARTGGAAYGEEPAGAPRVYVPGRKAVLMDDGYAAAPADAPVPVQNAIFAANKIVKKPYLYGGGHGSWEDEGYDCSSTISYALHGGGMLKSPLDSTSFMSWGKKGKGAWITVYTNPGHAYVVIAGLRLDTSAYGDTRDQGRGPRWRGKGRPTRGFTRRHPVGF